MKPLRSLIDEKKRAEVKKALAEGRLDKLLEKRKAQPEPVLSKQPKKQLSRREQEELNRQLIKAIENYNPDAAKEALMKGADPDFIGEINREIGPALALVADRWYWETQITRLDTPKDRKERNDRFQACREIVELLLTSGADPNIIYRHHPIIRFFEWNEPIWMGESRIFDLLKKYGAKE